MAKKLARSSGQKKSHQPQALRAAIYVRVSTDEQTTKNWRPELERLARQRGFQVAALYDDTASGAKVRPELERLMADARRGAFDVVVISALDRFGRPLCFWETCDRVRELDRLGVRVVAALDPWLDTTGPARELLLPILAWVASGFRQRLIENTRAGMARARREGKQIGRRRRAFNVKLALELAGEGVSIREIAQRVHAPRATVARRLEQEASRAGRRAPKASAAAG